MEVKNPLNPWSVEDVDVFLFYCCPQCDHRSKSKASFIEHAFLDHPESKENVKTENLKIEPFPEETLLVNIKEEAASLLEQDNDLDYLFEEADDEEDQPLVKKKGKKKVVKKEKEVIEDEDDDKEYQCYRYVNTIMTPCHSKVITNVNVFSGVVK